MLGFHVGPEGRVVGPRVMQSAYSEEIDRAAQAAFSQAVLDSAGQWRFQSAPAGGPTSNFAWLSVGFRPGADRTVQTVIGEDAQDPRLAGRCVVDDLATWGEANSITVDDARARHDESVRVAPHDEALLWTARSGVLASPMYPREMMKVGAEACMVLGLVVGVDGAVRSARVLDLKVTRAASSRMVDRLVANALQAAWAWHYSPGPDNPFRMPAVVQVPVEYLMGRQGQTGRCTPVDVARLVDSGGETGAVAP